MTAPGRSDPYLALIRERYRALESIAQEKEAAGQGEHEVVIVYYTAGERIEVVGDIYIDDLSGILIIEGVDTGDNYCEVIAHPESTHFVLEILPIGPEEDPRQKPGFVKEDRSP